MPQTDLLELDLKPASTFDYAPATTGALATRQPAGVGLQSRRIPAAPASQIIDAEIVRNSPNAFESSGDYATRQRRIWADSDERLINDLRQIDDAYDRRIRDIDSDAAVRRAELDAERRAIGKSGRSANMTQRVAVGAAALGEAINGLGAYQDSRRAGNGLGESFGRGVGRAVGGLGGSIQGQVAGAAAGVAVQGVGAAEPTSSGIGAAIGGVAGAIAGAEIGGRVGEAVGGAIGRTLDNLADWITGEDGASDISNIQEGGEYFDPDLEGAFEGGQCAITYRVSLVTLYDNGSQSNPVTNTYLGPIVGIGPTPTPGRVGDAIFYEGGNKFKNWNTTTNSTINRRTIISNVATLGGVPDTCGNRPNAVSDPTRAPAIGAPTLSPLTELPNYRLPGLEPQPTGQPRTEPDPKDDPDPTTEPDPTLDPDPDPFPDPTPDPFDRPEPDLPDLEPDPTPTPTRPENDGCNPCAKLDEVLGLLRSEFSNTLLLTPCEAVGGDPITGAVNGVGFQGLSATNQLILQGLTEVWNRVKCDSETYGSVPESYMAKAPSITPQLQIQFKEVNSKKTSRWHLTIPHFNEAYRENFSVSPYARGDIRCQLDLADNSKLIVNASSKSGGMSVIGQCLSYVLPQYQVPLSNIKYYEIPNRGIRNTTVEPCYAKYFEGALENPPKWTRKLTQ